MNRDSITIWMNLLGFEKNDADKGVGRFLDTTGYKPDAITGLLCHPDFFNQHRGMTEKYILPPDNCAYYGAPRNLERERQEWTNYDLRELVSGLHKEGIEFYAGVFGSYMNDAYHREWINDYPELFRPGLKNGNNREKLFALKRFKDGSYYEDFFVDKVCETLTDYGMDGIHLSDGFCPPAGGMLHNLDFSSDFVDQFLEHSGITLPKELADTMGDDDLDVQAERGRWIYREHRLEWIEFNAWRWEGFFRKLCTRLHAIGKKVLVLGMYATDPFESLYCIGISLRKIVEAGVDAITANILPTGCYIMGRDERPYYFYKYMALAATTAAHLPKGHLVSMLGVQDSTEEWNAIYDRPVMHQRDMYTMMAFQMIDKDGIARALDGFFLCLGDGLSRHDWEWEKERLDIALSAKPVKLYAPVMLWSEYGNEALLPEYIKTRRWTPHKFYYELMKAGEFVGGTILPEAVIGHEGPIFVPCFDLLSEAEQKLLKEYRGGAVIATACPDFDVESLTPSLVIDDKFSDYPTRVFVLGAKLNDSTLARISELISMDDGTDNLGGDIANLPEPDYTLTDTLVFSKVTVGMLEAIALMLKSATSSPFEIDKPHIVMQMPGGAYRLYIFNDSEEKYHRAFVKAERDVKDTKFISKFPVLPPKFMAEATDALHHVYGDDAPKNSFQVKIQPGGVTIMDVYL